MIRLYLFLNGIIYIILGSWCTISPEFTSNLIGLPINNPQGYAEYLAVYGGLEIGVGLYFLLMLLKKSQYTTAVIFGALFYGGIVLCRTIAILTYSNNLGFGWNLYLCEVIFFTWSLVLLKNHQE